VAKARNFYIVDSDVKAAAFSDQKVLDKSTINLSSWSFFTNPRADFRGIFFDAWRLERDYFYDRNMQGGGLERHARALSADGGPRLGP